MSKKILNKSKIILFFISIITAFLCLNVLFSFVGTKSMVFAEEIVEPLKEINILSDIKTVTYDGYPVTYDIRGEHYKKDFEISYFLGGEEIESDPVDAGVYDVLITRPQDDEFLAFEKYIPCGLVINKRRVEISICDILLGTPDFVYDKTQKQTTAEVSGLLNGDELSYTLGYELDGKTTPIDAGCWQVFVAEAHITKGDSKNYEIDITDTGVLNIAPKEIGLSWKTFLSSELVYDGNEKVSACEALDVIDGDTVNVIIKLKDGCDNVNAGKFSYEAVGVDNSNYKLCNDISSPIYEITPKVITFTVNDIPEGTFVYDGTEKKTTATHTPLVGGDTLSYKLRYEKGESFNATSAGSWIVKIDSAKIESGLPNNYILDTTDQGVMVIDKKPIKIEIIDVLQNTPGYVYDGTEKKTTATHTPLCLNDEIVIELKYDLNGNENQIFAGEWVVSVKGVEFVRGDAENYQLDDSDLGVLVIDKRPATICWQTLSDSELVYSKSAKILNATVSDLIDGDECVVFTKLKDGCDNINAGEFYYSAVSLSNPNYIIGENELSPKTRIEKKHLNVTAKDITITYGDENIVYELEFSGFCPGDDIDVIDVLPTADSRWTKNTSTMYSGMAINCHGGSDNNYEFDYNNGVLTINKLAITVYAQDKASIEGNDLKKLTFETDISPVFGDAFIGSLSTNADKNTYGVYDIEQGSLYISENYVINFVKAHYYINAKSVKSTGDIDAVLTTIDGVSPDSLFVVTKISQDELSFDISQMSGYNTVSCYKMEVVGEIASTERLTVKIKVSGVGSVNDIRIAQVTNGKTEIKTVRSEGEYIVFNTGELGEFVVLEKQSSFVGVFVVIGIILVLIMLMYIFYTIKRKRDYETYRF